MDRLNSGSYQENLRLTTATAMGHMNQIRQNIRSTKERLLEPENEDITPLRSGEKHT
jgi:hypothetical protein